MRGRLDGLRRTGASIPDDGGAGGGYAIYEWRCGKVVRAADFVSHAVDYQLVE